MKNNLESIFDDMPEEEFEEFIKECVPQYEKVEKGKGGLFINGKEITIEDMDRWSAFQLVCSSKE